MDVRLQMIKQLLPTWPRVLTATEACSLFAEHVDCCLPGFPVPAAKTMGMLLRQSGLQECGLRNGRKTFYNPPVAAEGVKHDIQTI